MNLGREIAAFDPEVPIERAWTPPSAWYTSPAIHWAEERWVFAPAWQPVARRDDLATPGSYTSGRLVGEPWVVIRREDGGLAAFHNTCRHKGREVVEGSGRADGLVCGYHGWTYGLDGRLQSAPGMAGVRDFDRDALCLPPLEVEEWGPWVLLRLHPGSPPLGEAIGPVREALGEDPWDGLVFRGERTWTLRCNWKVVVDNYLDGGYHVPHMHPGLAAGLDMKAYETRVLDTACLQTAQPAEGGEDRVGEEARYLWLHPNLMWNRYGPFLDTNRVVPLGPDRCEVHYEFFAEPEVDAGFLEGSIAQSEAVQEEDTAICESVQRGLASTGFDRGRYAPRLEIGEHLFHRLLHRDLSAAT